MLLFTAITAAPILSVVWYLKESVTSRQEELRRFDDLRNLIPSDAISRVDAICKSCTNVSLLIGGLLFPIAPHGPEDSPLVLTEDEVVNNINATVPGTAAIFDAVTASRDNANRAPLSFVHFGVSGTSVAGKKLLSGKDKMVTLVYNGGPLGDTSVCMKGDGVVIDDERLRQFYWRDRWGAYIKKSDYILVKLIPSDVTVNSLAGGPELVDGINFRKVESEWKRL